MFQAIVHFRDQRPPPLPVKQKPPRGSSAASTSSSSSTESANTPARRSRRRRSLLYQVLVSPLRKKSAQAATPPKQPNPPQLQQNHVINPGHMGNQRNPLYTPPPSVYDDDPGIMSEVETSATGFRRASKARSSLPVVRTPSKTQERPLGSHDSFSSSITTHSDISPDEPDLYNSVVVRMLSCMSKRVICNWCKTQTLDCRQQLEAGIRYFDLRVATHPEDQALYVVHGLYGTAIGNVLKSVRDFLETHSKEIVLLDFQHLYDMGHFDHHKLLHHLSETFGAMLCPYVTDLAELTLSWLWERSFQVIVFYRDPVAQYHPFLWPADCIPNPWANTTSIKSLFTFLTEGYEKGREAGKFFVSQCILTPTLFLILRNLFGNLKNILVSGTNKELVKWLEDKYPGPNGLNIVICDFVDMNDYNIPRFVVSLNYKPQIMLNMPIQEKLPVA